MGFFERLANETKQMEQQILEASQTAEQRQIDTPKPQVSPPATPQELIRRAARIFTTSGLEDAILRFEESLGSRLNRDATDLTMHKCDIRNCKEKTGTPYPYTPSSPHSKVDIVLWDVVRNPSAKTYTVNYSSEYAVCQPTRASGLLFEASPSGVIYIRGGWFSTSQIPESSWASDPNVFEQEIAKRYKRPSSIRYGRIVSKEQYPVQDKFL